MFLRGLKTNSNEFNICLLVIFQNNQMATVKANTRSLEKRIRNIEFQNRQQESRFYASQEGDNEGGSLGVGLGDLPAGKPGVRMMLDLHFNFPAKTRKYYLDSLH